MCLFQRAVKYELVDRFATRVHAAAGGFGTSSYQWLCGERGSRMGAEWPPVCQRRELFLYRRRLTLQKWAVKRPETRVAACVASPGKSNFIKPESEPRGLRFTSRS